MSDETEMENRLLVLEKKTLQGAIEELEEEINNLRSANGALDNDKRVLQEDVQTLQDLFDDKQGIVEEFLTDGNAQCSDIIVTVNDGTANGNEFGLKFVQIESGRWHSSTVCFSSGSLEIYLRGLEDRHAQEMSRLREDMRRLDCEINRLRATVGMLGITSSVPNAEEIANEQNQMARK